MADLWQIWQTTEEKIDTRLKAEGKQLDTISYMTNAQGASTPSKTEYRMSLPETEINAILIVIAGSESVTTVLTGTIKQLLRNHDKLKNLTHEIRSTFPDEGNINGVSLSRLPYLNAVLHEGLRLCPTIPDGMTRQVPKRGAVVTGRSLPEGTVVSIPQWATYQSAGNFASPTTFAPERWLEDSNTAAYKADREDMFWPFSLGAHICPRKGLAYLKMRLILARLVWNLDLERPSSTSLPQWEKQKIFWFWEKQATNVKISRANESQ